MKLSVMMITYNHERFIAQALESILAQRVDFEYEIVVGEDCSTDNTREILKDFQRLNPGRIVSILRTKNIGAISNFAATIAACRGRYLAVLEGDDYWTDQNKLQKQVEFLDSHPDFAICCHRVRFLDEMGTLDFEVHPSFSGSYTIEDLLRMNFVISCSAVLRRELIGPLPSWFFGLALGDWPLFALVATQGKVEVLDEIMATYRVHSAGIWSSRSIAFRLREISRMLRALDRHLEFRYTDTIRQTVCRCDLDAALLEREHGRRVGTARQVLTCLRHGGWNIPEMRRALAGLAAYAVIGSWYKLFSRANSVSS
jgi:glycosyltransferase involved in cell wall biosynthesis